MTDNTTSRPAGPLSRQPNPARQDLQVFVGAWNTAGTHPLFPGATSRGQVSFAWLEEAALLVMRADFEPPGPPSGLAVIGGDEADDTYCMLYFDERGVSRIYKMSLAGRVWKIWRESPGFSQRFTGTFSDDGNTITALWDKSNDGSHWERDLELTYTKVG